MGIGGLYTVGECRQTESGCDFSVRLDPSHPIFDGHFPGEPILPGVCTLYIVKDCVSRAVGHNVRYRGVKEVKFLAAILPADHTEFEVHISLTKEDDGGYALRGEVWAEGESMLKIKAVLE